MSLNQVTITDKGLLNVNRKIINDRKFEKSLISTVGNVVLKDSIASEFDRSSYIEKRNLALKDAPTTIVFKGTFISSPSNSNQTCWILSGSSQGSIILQFVTSGIDEDVITYPQLVLPSGQTISFEKVPFSDEMTFKVITDIKPNLCTVILNIGNEATSEEFSTPETINLSDYNYIAIGNNTEHLFDDTNLFWEGSIDVKDFLISQNSIPVFTPTIGYSLNFTRVVISDGKFPLTEDHIPPTVAKHLYIYDIDEITRSENTILLTTELNKESKLTIREIGLYAQVDGNEFLFGYIKGLNVDRGASVPYDLILTVNLAISAVNVVGFPDSNSFILNQVKPALLKNFTTVLNTNTYVIENLERIIRMNSLQPIPRIGYCGRRARVTSTIIDDQTQYDITYDEGKYCCTNPRSIQSIGYNTPQVIYRAHKEINRQEDCYFATQTYAKLFKNFKKETKEVFDPSLITYTEDLNISDNGVATGFSNLNYITSIPSIDLLKAWELNISFSINNIATSKEGVITMGYLEKEYNEEEVEIKTKFSPYLYLFIEGNELKYSLQSNGTSSASIGSLEIIDPNTQYFLRLSSLGLTESAGSYSGNLKIESSIDNQTFTTLENLDIVNFDGTELNSIVAGIHGYYANLPADQNLTVEQPFIDGTLYLANWSILQEDNNWSTMQTVYTFNNELLHYYHLPDYLIYSYKVHDLHDPSYYLKFLGDIYESNVCPLDFSMGSFSTSMKFNLQNDASKVLLSQVTLQGEELFKVEFVRTQSIDSTLYNFAFSFLTSEGLEVFTLSEPISSNNLRQYLVSPILLTILKNGQNITIYENNNLIIQGTLNGTISKPPSSSYITNNAPYKLNTNFIDTRKIELDWSNPESWTPKEVNNALNLLSGQGAIGITKADLKSESNILSSGFAFYSLYLGSDSSRKYTFIEATKEEALYMKGKYIKELIVIDNPINTTQLYYITNLTDTNF